MKNSVTYQHCIRTLLACLIISIHIIMPAAGQDKGVQPETGEGSPQKELDIRKIEGILQMKGKVNNGEFKVTIPQNDLNVEVDNFTIIPPMGLGSWAAFIPTAKGAMLMGDIVVGDSEIGPVQKVVINEGLTITAIHNHFVRNQPNYMYMHIGGMGSEEQLAKGVKAIFNEIENLRGDDPSKAEARTVNNTLDTQMIERITGHKGTMNRGVFKQVIGRPDVDLQEHNYPVSTFSGFNTWASWQGTPEKAAVAGDFTMLASEVEHVVKALIENDIEVVALHNHMIHENPRIFFLHYWGTGPAKKLAKGLKEALDKTGGSEKLKKGMH